MIRRAASFLARRRDRRGIAAKAWNRRWKFEKDGSGEELAAFGMRERGWIRHALIVGMTGPGKTTRVYRILARFVRHEKPFLGL